MSQSFESFHQAEERTAIKQRKMEIGTNKPKNHIGSNVDPWNQEDCLNEVLNYEEGDSINFTELARKYGVHNKDGNIPGNAGQIVKEYLKVCNIPLEKLNNSKVTQVTRIRRAKRKLDGIDITIPTELTTEQVKLELKKMIDTGDITIGELIVPQKFKKLVMSDDFKANIIEVEVRGRKNPLKSVREQMNRNHEKFFRIYSDAELNELSKEELVGELSRINEMENKQCEVDVLRDKLKFYQRRRHLQLWHDGSCIANNSYMLFMVNALYDKALYLTNEEYFCKYGKNIDVQAQIEKPQLYIIAKCPSNEQQLLYINTRNEDNKLLQTPTIVKDNIELNDIMKFFHGDGPACEFEAGQQKGGDHPCWVCPINMTMSNDIPYSLYQPILTLDDRMEKVMMTTHSRQKVNQNTSHMYSNLKVHELNSELHERGIKFNVTDKKEIKEKKLKNEISGIQRLPTLYFNEFERKDNLNLEQYEILPCEPLHDVKGHISNLYEVIINHVTTEEKKLMKEIIAASFENKECRRGVDYRKSLIKVVIALNGKIDSIVYKILSTMCEIQELLYTSEENRTIEIILRLHNQIFLHMVLLNKVVRMNTSPLSTRCFYGKYYHALIAHAAVMLRMVSGIAANTEEEERAFNTIKTITSSTSNYHADHIILNNMIRIQCKDKFYAGYNNAEQNSVMKLAAGLPKKEPSLFPFWILRKENKAWQAHLELIADYLLEKDLWWFETTDGIIFNDVEKNSNSHLQPHHFRSTSLKQVKSYLESCWKQCIENTKLIPANKIIIENEYETTNLETLSTLNNIINKEVAESLMPEPLVPANENEIVHKVKDTPIATIANINKSKNVNEIHKNNEDILCELREEPVNKEVNNELNLNDIEEDTSAQITFKLIVPTMNQSVNTIHETGTSHLNTKTAKLMFEIIPDQIDTIQTFDKIRLAFKKNVKDNFLKKQYLDLSAKIEIAILILYDKMKDQLKSIEKEQWETGKGLSLLPTKRDENNKYHKVVSVLKKIQILRNEMKF